MRRHTVLYSLFILCVLLHAGCASDADEAPADTRDGLEDTAAPDADDAASTDQDTAATDEDAATEDAATEDADAQDADAQDARDTGSQPRPQVVTIGPDARPARLFLPSAHDGTTPLPLLVFLHGYTSDSQTNAVLYLGLDRIAEAEGAYLLLPEGTVDPQGNPFWNATDACCDFYNSGVDDVAYLTGLLDAAEAEVAVDARRVYFAGHSNGGFMSYRMACERAERIAAVFVLAGADQLDAEACAPAAPVAVVHAHGDLDATILYEGGGALVGVGEGYPSAQAAATRWAARNGCAPTPQEGAPVDLVGDAAAETTVTRHDEGCAAGMGVELYTLVGEGHIPLFKPAGVSQLMTALFSYARP